MPPLPNWTTTASRAWRRRLTERPSHRQRRYLAATPASAPAPAHGVYSSSNGTIAPGDGLAKPIDGQRALPGAAANGHAEQAIEASDEPMGFVDAMFDAPLGLRPRAVAANGSLRYARS